MPFFVLFPVILQYSRSLNSSFEKHVFLFHKWLFSSPEFRTTLWVKSHSLPLLWTGFFSYAELWPFKVCNSFPSPVKRAPLVFESGLFAFISHQYVSGACWECWLVNLFSPSGVLPLCSDSHCTAKSLLVFPTRQLMLTQNFLNSTQLWCTLCCGGSSSILVCSSIKTRSKYSMFEMAILHVWFISFVNSSNILFQLVCCMHTKDELKALSKDFITFFFSNCSSVPLPRRF